MNFRPMSDCILVKQDVEKSDIIIRVKETKLAQGTIAAVGPGRISSSGKLLPMQLAVGQRVYFGEHTGQLTIIEGEEYLVMHEPDIAGVADA